MDVYDGDKIPDWHSNWFPEEDVTMKTYLFSDSHFNHANIATYCDRPADFTQLIEKRWNETVTNDDVVIHLGDVAIGNKTDSREIIERLNGMKILIRGNHDRQKSNTWWMTKGGFHFSCDGLMFRSCFLSHEPANTLPEGCILNIHGHLHNIWHGFHPNASVNISEEEWMKDHNQLTNPWQRLFACEYTDYRPVEFDKFVSNPNKYYAKGIPNENPDVSSNGLVHPLS